jgi:heterodisulfide reductase subunit A
MTNGTNGTIRIGVYVCHCGSNIAGKVRVDEVMQFGRDHGPHVVVAREYKYMCSDPGQELIKKDIQDLHLNRIVVASCSPLMHELTFRRAAEEGGINPYFFQMANIREHCSWVTEDPDDATDKAKALLLAAIHRVAHHQPLEAKTVPVNPNVLVVGAGIAGIHAALDIAHAGNKVTLVEQKSYIGGHMSRFDKTFPTLDCAACILTPKTVSVAQNKNIDLMTLAGIKEVNGFVGNFKVKIERKARYVDTDKCTGCGVCWEKCPGRRIPAARTIVKGKLVIGDNRGKPAPEARPAAAPAGEPVH